MRWVLGLLFILLVAFAGAYVVAGRGAPPALAIAKPDRFVGQIAPLEVTADAPNGRFTALAITVEQNGKTIPLYRLNAGAAVNAGASNAGQPSNTSAATVTPIDRNRIRIAREIGKRAIPELQAGPATIVVTASRPGFLNLRTLSSSARKQIDVRLEPPRIAVVSTHHYINHGGSEMVVYRATPSDVESGVRVGTVEYRGFPASGAYTSEGGGAASNGAASGPGNDLNVAFFALLPDQPLDSPIQAFARDQAGNQVKASFIDNVFEKPFKKSRIELDDKFINRVVPEILEHSPELKLEAPAQGSDMLPAFLKINGELRRINADQITAFNAKTSPARLWSGPFVQLGNSQVEARFADHRTYFYGGKEVDQQVHLGFDLAVTEHVPVLAANTGRVLNASWLGIYGNCVVIDHGMGVQSLYGHLMSFDVNVGDTVKRGQQIGRSDSTGLAGGDHLHFTMLVGGQMVNPVEWWDQHWITDRVERKLGEAR